MKSTLLATLLLTTTALAEAQRPRIAVHPLVLDGVDSKKDREDLTALLPGIVIAVGKVEIASPSDVDAELKKKGQAFCAADNLFKCLSYIAEHTTSVHALRIELRRGGRVGEWELVANVVRVDGFVERQPDVFKFTQPDTVKLVPIARARLEEFVATLNLSTLPLAPPVKVAVVDPPPVLPNTNNPTSVEIPGIAQPPPPPPPESSTPPMRATAFVLSGVTVISLGASLGLALSAQSDASAVRMAIDGNQAVHHSELGLAMGIDAKSSAAVACLVIGTLAGATAATLFVLSKDADRTTTLVPAPFPGGAGVVLSSNF